MHHPEIRIRRARRTDFAAIASLLGCEGDAATRQNLRIFRRVVADLGSDFYVAAIDDVLVGFVHVSYTRQLFAAPLGRVERIGAREDRRDEITRVLMQFARERAVRRGSRLDEIGEADPVS